jgi:hypothetical protein
LAAGMKEIPRRVPGLQGHEKNPRGRKVSR